MIQTKICRKCHLMKSLEDFYNDNGNNDGKKSACKTCEIYSIKIYQHNHKEKLKNSNKKWKKNNKQKTRMYRNKWRRKNMKTGSCLRLTYNLRRRLNLALKGENKSTSTLNLLGCTNEQLRSHLEGKFTSNMTWENYGVYGWHIDHIKPCSSFDLSLPEEQSKCFHFTNLQPLWATTKIAKENGEENYIGNIEKYHVELNNPPNEIVLAGCGDV